MTPRRCSTTPTTPTGPRSSWAASQPGEAEASQWIIRDAGGLVPDFPIWSLYANPALLAGATDLEPDVPARLRLMIDFMATRTAFFDEFFLDAADAGVRQVVILASGLDARAWRLPWPDGTVVYELDQPKVLEFKCRNATQPRRPTDGTTGERANRPASGLADYARHWI